MRRRLFIGTAASAAALTALPARADNTDRPNILWLTCEDNNINWLGCYGNPQATTPNIDQLARDGFLYTHAYANAPVCAPSRSTWITGVNAVSMGTHPMRSRYPIPHDLIQYYPDHLKANGYYVGNSTKTDYNIGGRDDKEAWDNPGKVNWDALKANQPFFQVVNSTTSHESKAFGDVYNSKHDPKNMKLRAYHPDVPGMRENYAHYQDAIERMDGEIGASLKKLEELGLAENTIVVHNSDHGGVLPRSKRYIFQSGIHCPLIVRVPERYRNLWPAEKPGSKVDRLVSFVDMPKTWLSLTGTPIPDYMQGTIFLGPGAEPEQPFHFAFRGRMDERCENARAVCDKKFLYIRNYMPYAPWMQTLGYLWKMEATQAWEKHVQSGKATEVQSRFFNAKGWTEELYDMEKDPDNVENLIDNPEYREIVAKARVALRGWQEEIRDTGLIPESDMARRAAENDTTIYELARDPKLYDLPAYLDAADLALAEDPANLKALRALLKSEDAGTRYWGVVGCFLLNDQRGARRVANDDSHEVRAMAAWTLTRSGAKDEGLAILDALIREESYSLLKILNIVDWMGEDAEPLVPALMAATCEQDREAIHQNHSNIRNYLKRMRATVLEKFGAQPPAQPKKKKAKKKK